MGDGQHLPSRRSVFGASLLALAWWPLRRLGPGRPDHPIPGPRPPDRGTVATPQLAARPRRPDPPAVPPTTTPPSGGTSPPYNTAVPDRRITVELPTLPLPIPDGWGEQTLGPTAQGTPIQMLVRHPTTETRRRLLVVCGIHGNELGTVPLAQRLLSVPVPDGVLVAVIPALNPDGWANQSRYNAATVDLNRNFPWRWAPSDGGPAPGSEAETQAVMGLVQANPWDLVVWVHQPLGYVAAVPPSERSYAEAWCVATGLPYREDLDQHGGGETWTAKVAGVASMLVEVQTHDATTELIESHATGYAAVLALLA